MKVQGIDFKQMKVLQDMLDAIECDYYMKCSSPNPPPLKNVTTVHYYSDIWVKGMTDSEIHLQSIVGCKKSNKAGEEKYAEALYECRIPLTKLLDESVRIRYRMRSVKWVQTACERSEGDGERSEGEVARITG